MVNTYHVDAMGWATKEEVARISEIALKVNEILTAYFAKANVTLVDYKLEFGRFHGEIVLADEISPDTCRFWDATTAKSWIKTVSAGIWVMKRKHIRSL